MSIQFFSEGISFKLAHPRKTKAWIEKVVKKETGIVSELTFIFCSDAVLLPINQQFLHHSTLTDIITFNLSEPNSEIRGEIYISVERVRENALNFQIPLDEELHRVIIHGVLHLLGYNDKKVREKAIMREKEEACLSLR